jgi:membrane protease YdiL (CAAX protease family)
MTDAPYTGRVPARGAAGRPAAPSAATLFRLVVLWPAAATFPVALALPPALALPCVAATLVAYLRSTLLVRAGAGRAARLAELRARPLGPEWPLVGIAATVAVTAATLLHLALPTVDGGSRASDAVDAYAARGPLHAAAVVLVGVAATPLMEEVAFRGAITTVLARRCGEPAALFGASLLFAVAHLRRVAVPELFAVGAILGLLAWGARSVWASVIGHALWNALAFVARARPPLDAAVGRRLAPFALVALLLATAGALAWLLVQLRRATARGAEPSAGEAR